VEGQVGELETKFPGSAVLPLRATKIKQTAPV
jgi:hypothetical protein